MAQDACFTLRQLSFSQLLREFYFYLTFLPGLFVKKSLRLIYYYGVCDCEPYLSMMMTSTTMMMPMTLRLFCTTGSFFVMCNIQRPRA